MQHLNCNKVLFLKISYCKTPKILSFLIFDDLQHLNCVEISLCSKHAISQNPSTLFKKHDLIVTQSKRTKLGNSQVFNQSTKSKNHVHLGRLRFQPQILE